MPKPTDPAKHAYMFSDDMKFFQKIIVFHPIEPERFLAIRRSTDSTRPGTWDLPGGNVLYGENHEASLMKEINEEIGVQVDDVHPIIVRSNYQNNIYYLAIYYRGIATEEEVLLSPEHTEYRWVTVQEFMELESAAYLQELMRTVFAL